MYVFCDISVHILMRYFDMQGMNPEAVEMKNLCRILIESTEVRTAR
jgi:hypothetical protein